MTGLVALNDLSDIWWRDGPANTKLCDVDLVLQCMQGGNDTDG